VLTIVSLDTLGGWAFGWIGVAGLVATVWEGVRGGSLSRSVLAGTASAVFSFPLLLPALVAVLVAVYGLAILLCLVGVDAACEP
jgi:hypothetical protein